MRAMPALVPIWATGFVLPSVISSKMPQFVKVSFCTMAFGNTLVARETDAYFVIRCSPNSPVPGLSSHRKASATMIITHKGYRLEGRMTSKSFHALVLAAALLVVGPLVASPRAQDEKRMEAAQPDRTYPGGLETAFEWRYSCPGGMACSFDCAGAGGASNVTKLAIRLGTIPVGKAEHAAGVFYEFSTMQIARANGFALTTGISTLSCQVQGMDLDYSGPRDTPTESISDSR
jgi:hypothetical protein